MLDMDLTLIESPSQVSWNFHFKLLSYQLQKITSSKLWKAITLVLFNQLGWNLCSNVLLQVNWAGSAYWPGSTTDGRVFETTSQVSFHFFVFCLSSVHELDLSRGHYSDRHSRKVTKKLKIIELHVFKLAIDWDWADWMQHLNPML
jgi:hypothetical protein